MISERNRRLILFFSLLVGLLSAASASHSSYDAEPWYDTGFRLPDYDSHSEILVQFVAPFIFLTILLHLALSQALHFTFVDRRNRGYWRTHPGAKPPVRRMSLLMSLAITGMLVPTPFWTLVQSSLNVIGMLAVLVFVFLMLVVFAAATGRGGGNTS